MSVDTGTELEPIPAELERPKINLHYVSGGHACMHGIDMGYDTIW